MLSLVLCASSLFASGSPASDPIPVLIVSGANNHDWEWTTPSLQRILAYSGKFDVDVTYKPGEFMADAAALEKYAALVLDYNGPRWGQAAEKNFLDAVRGGTGVSVIHAANNAFPGWVEYETLVADLWRQGTGHGRFHRFDVKITDRDHPITRDMQDIVSHPDELYHNLVHMHDAERRVLASAFSSRESGGTGEDEPMILVLQFGEGRVFHTPLGHVWKGNESLRASHDDPQFQDLVVRGTEWAATGDVTPTVHNQLTEAEAADGWTLLFDGETSEGWRSFKKESFPEKGWVVEDGCLHIRAGGGAGDIITTGKYKSFDFVFDWKVAQGANSGVFYRVTETEGTVWRTGPEYQILDNEHSGDGKRKETSAAALYAMYPANNAVPFPVGRFNRGRILIEGDRVRHYLNGVLVVDAKFGSEDWNQRYGASKFNSMPNFGKSPEGHLALQDHGNDVWFRNLKIKEL